MIKQQSESHQQQIKNIIARYEELQQQMTNLTFGQNLNTEKNSQKTGNFVFEAKNSYPDYSKITKELQELIFLASQQVKNEVDQKFEIFQSKNSIFLKNFESKIETFAFNDEKTRQEIDKKIEKIEKKSENVKKDVENKIEAALNMNLERYKELTHKINAGTGYSLNEEIIGIRQKFSKIEEFKKNFEENEVRRELEVKEASQSA